MLKTPINKGDYALLKQMKNILKNSCRSPNICYSFPPFAVEAATGRLKKPVDIG
jgi:hypothetical protein